MGTSTADAEIRDVVKDYAEGMTYADEAQLRRAFHPRARSIGHYRGELEWQSVDEFIDSCRQVGPLPAGTPFFWKIASLEIVGDVASVKVIDDYQGTRFSDFLTLLKVDGRWQIVNKTFYDHG